MKNKFKNIIIAPSKSVTFTPRELALIARRFKPNARLRCKGDLQKLLSPEQFDECWRIRELQAKRSNLKGCEYYEELHGLSNHERRAIKRKAWKSTRRWGRAFMFGCDYRSHLASPIQKTWKYKSRVKYSVNLCHSHSKVEYSSNRPACSYKTLDVTLTWNLLLHRWQWVGGMLTISAKADAGKRNYPCWWFQQRHNADGPCVGLEVKRGWIINGNYHVSAVNNEAEARKKRASIMRRANEKLEVRAAEIMARDSMSYKAPKGWVNRMTSIAAGNCQGGTDNFIQSRVVPFFQKQGYVCGDLRGISIRAKTLLEIERSALTRRVCSMATK